MEYRIEIVETLSITQIVVASSLEEALKAVHDDYSKASIVLTADNFIHVEFLPSQKRD
jgi:hypothetical protein